MNYRLVLKTYTALRQLTGEESALLNTLRNMNESEQELMIVTLAPQKATKKPTKKRGKTQRAALLREHIQATTQPPKSLDGGVSKMRCAADSCGEYADHNVHHLNTHPDYHEFTPAQSAAASGGD